MRKRTWFLVLMIFTFCFLVGGKAQTLHAETKTTTDSTYEYYEYQYETASPKPTAVVSEAKGTSVAEKYKEIGKNTLADNKINIVVIGVLVVTLGVLSMKRSDWGKRK